MKSTKIYIFLLAIAFLSFSCDEDNNGDKKENKEEEVTLSTLAEDFIPSESTSLIYNFKFFNFGTVVNEAELYYKYNNYESYKNIDAIHTETEYKSTTINYLYNNTYYYANGPLLLASTNGLLEFILNNFLIEKGYVEEAILKNEFPDWMTELKLDSQEWVCLDVILPTKFFNENLYFKISCERGTDTILTVENIEYKGFNYKHRVQTNFPIISGNLVLWQDSDIISDRAYFEHIGMGKASNLRGEPANRNNNWDIELVRIEK